MQTVLSPTQARKLLSKILLDPHGEVVFTRHAREEMLADDLSVADVYAVLRTGRIFESGELLHGSFRYRVHSANCCAVVAFSGDRVTVVVTTWRKGP